MNQISTSLKEFTTSTFNSLDSPNSFSITITHQASWWLTSLDSPYFKALEESVKDIWGKEPLKIREGGTVPTIFWLEREFEAPCVHLPLGQVSSSVFFFASVLLECMLKHVGVGCGTLAE
jgi:di- and tripeptidase